MLVPVYIRSFFHVLMVVSYLVSFVLPFSIFEKKKSSHFNTVVFNILLQSSTVSVFIGIGFWSVMQPFLDIWEDADIGVLDGL